MHGIDVVISVGWVAFWLYWLIAAAGAKATRARSGQSIGIRAVIAGAVILLFRTHAFRSDSTHAVVAAVIGVALWALGLAVAIWARLYLGRNWGTPMSQRAQPELVTSGPYRWVRNPIYSGIILAMVGTAIAVNVDWFVVVVLLGGFFVYSAFAEERFLAAEFPDTYPAYKRSSKRLIPFVF